jgi:hypothetical protein
MPGNAELSVVFTYVMQHNGQLASRGTEREKTMPATPHDAPQYRIFGSQRFYQPPDVVHKLKRTNVDFRRFVTTAAELTIPPILPPSNPVSFASAPDH